MNVLMVWSEIPYPPRSGSRMRVYQFIRASAERYTLTLLAYQYWDDEWAHVQSLRNLCRVEVVRWHEPPLLALMHADDPLIAGQAYRRSLLHERIPFLAQ